MVIWPVVIRYFGDDELTLITDESEWVGDADLHFHAYTVDDEMIDSNGRVYHLKLSAKGQQNDIVETGRTKTLSEFDSLVKKHMVSLDQCCSSKIRLSTISDGMSLIEKLGD